ncbi:MAG: Glu/Leu/Phe/Val dehydrogenase dimerization domain-containing protein [Pseudomonadota bacterium]|nr:Glu/Leu/Phe/Val dehydrogenase dimerization domain-containing protein [Pseudomonadota bacterium]
MAMLFHDSQFESILVHQNRELGYTGIIALHDTRPGPAIGGCRWMHYADNNKAIEDAKCLALAMSRKARLHDLPFGGGKAVINAKHDAPNREAILEDFSLQLSSLQGQYVTAVDIGTTAKDMDIIAQHTKHVLCTSSNPHASYYTALGVISALQVAAEHYLQSNLSSRQAAIQGMGSVGSHCMELLKPLVGSIYFADSNPDKLQGLDKTTMVEPDRIYSTPADLFIPCASGGVITPTTCKQLSGKIICGAANNPLAHDITPPILSEANIHYLPDVLVNAGGLIYASSCYLGLDKKQIVQNVMRIRERCEKAIYEASQQQQSLADYIYQHHFSLGATQC